MSDEQAMTKDPNYTPPPLVIETENEHRAWSGGFSKGYQEGRDDLLFALAKGHEWAIEKLNSVKSEID